MKSILKLLLIVLIGYTVLYVSFSFAANIDNVNKWAWGRDIGWVNFNPAGGNVNVGNTEITGHIWSDNYGWVNMQPTNAGVSVTIRGLNGSGTCMAQV